MEEQQLTRNTISFIGLSTEFCHALMSVSEYEKNDFIMLMLRLLPRIYISVSDSPVEQDVEAYSSGYAYVDEQLYESVRSRIAALLGADDSYLETFEEDMKYSDVPIGASISEALADIFQDLFNFVSAVRDAGSDAVSALLADCRASFETYWSQKLCNVFRALNSICYNKEN